MEINEIKNNFSRNISKLRKNKKISQAQMAKDLSYSDKAISKWETGETMPDIFTLEKIASYFNTTVDDLIHEEAIIRKANRHKNRTIITIASCGLCILIGTIVFLVLEMTNVPLSYLAFISGMALASVCLVVFAAIWFTKSYLLVAISLCIWAVSFLLIVIFDFKQLLLFCAIALIANIIVALILKVDFKRE